MQIKINSRHKSIPEGLEFVMPKFSILTGINGSGKSHLLEAIGNTTVSSVQIDRIIATQISYVGYNALNPQVTEQSDKGEVISSITNFWLAVQEVVRTYHRYTAAGHRYTSETEISQFLKYHSTNKIINPALINIIKSTGKRLEDLTQEDISNNLGFSNTSQEQLFFSQIALIFKTYHTRLYNNDLAEFRSQKHAKALPYLSTEEFLAKFGPPPWELINNTLTLAGLPYQVSSPENIDVDLPYNLKLIDPEKNVEISVNDLSSGEKVLMSLALAIYNTGVAGMKPDLLLLDEPDAPLHPHFSKLLIDVVLDTIVTKAGVNVIMTTHSPSTIAMAPDGSIFEITKAIKTPRLVSNAYALEMLTEGISYLHVSYEKRKQVFVESKYDVLYYQRLYNLLARNNQFDFQPVFLEPHSGTSNCTDVISLVKKLRDSGSDLAYGIIDYDGTNISSNSILVLGEGSRYAIENYILDPLYLALTLIRHAKKSFSDFGVPGKNTYMDAAELTQHDCQALVDTFLTGLSIRLDDPIFSTYENGMVVSYPRSFLFHQGHGYEALLFDVFPELKAVSKGQGDSGLKLGVIQVIEELPGFLPIEVRKTLGTLLGIK